MPDLQTQQLMKQPPNNSIQKQMQDRSFLWCIQLISFPNACIIHGAMPLYMVLCHYTWWYAIIHGAMPLYMVICHSSEPVKSWKLSARKRRLVTRLSASHENRSPKAQLGQRLTEKPGQYWLGFESPMVHGIFLPVSLQCRLSYGIRTAPVWFVSQSPFNADSLTVFAQPPCAIACINICVHVKNPEALAAI